MSKPLLRELQPDNRLFVRAELGDKELELETNILELSEADYTKIQSMIPGVDFVAVESIHTLFNDREAMVIFSEKKAHLSAISSINGQAWVWKNIQIFVTEISVGKIHVIICGISSTALNRRSGVRVVCGSKGSIKVGGRVFDCQVNDVSFSGMGIFIDKDCDIKVGKAAVLTFYDDTSNDREYSVPLQIVRRDKVTENTDVIGCKIEKNHHMIFAGYVNRKQMMLNRHS